VLVSYFTSALHDLHEHHEHEEGRPVPAKVVADSRAHLPVTSPHASQITSGLETKGMVRAPSFMPKRKRKGSVAQVPATRPRAYVVVVLCVVVDSLLLHVECGC